MVCGVEDEEEQVNQSRYLASEPGLGISIDPRFSALLLLLLFNLSATRTQLGFTHLNSSNGVPVQVLRLPVEMAAQPRPGSADCVRVAPPCNRRPVRRL